MEDIWRAYLGLSTLASHVFNINKYTALSIFFYTAQPRRGSSLDLRFMFLVVMRQWHSASLSACVNIWQHTGFDHVGNKYHGFTNHALKTCQKKKDKPRGGSNFVCIFYIMNMKGSSYEG